jgi:phage tail sheath gpL-like
MSSTAVGSERVSKIVGYKILKGDFRETSPNLPQRIAILGEANHSNQTDLADDEPQEITTAQQAGELYGFGSPLYHIMRILRPLSGDGVGGIPTVVYPQAEAVGATEKIVTVIPSGTATDNGTHTLMIAGRAGMDGVFYDIQIESGDTVADIAQKIEDAINAVLGSPVSAASTDYEATLTTKWRGLTANDLVVEVNDNGNDLGIDYDIDVIQAGSGTPSIAAALPAFGNQWNTIVINSYGTVTGILNALESFNGLPDAISPTGRYAAILMKPFIAIAGSVSDDPSAITDSRKTQVTNAIAPAPGSDGFPFEASANMGRLMAVQAQNSPHLDVSGQSYPDMPTPTSIGSMADYENRDAIVKKGCSTVDLLNSRYVVQDFVTTYHPVGENPPQFRYVRNLVIDFNVRYTYYIQEQINVVDKALVADNDVVSVDNVIKPKQWKQITFNMADDLAKRALIVNALFMQQSIVVNISTSNPDRFETAFKYKRSGFSRVVSTDATAGFNFGTLN